MTRRGARQNAIDDTLRAWPMALSFEPASTVSKRAACELRPGRQNYALVLPVFVSRPVPDRRTQPHPEATSPTQCRAVLVGVGAESLEVEVVFVRLNGTMSFRGHVYRVPPGYTAVGEAITTLGLTRLRRFSAHDLVDALQYVRRLCAEMKDDAPHIL